MRFAKHCFLLLFTLQTVSQLFGFVCVYTHIFKMQDTRVSNNEAPVCVSY